MTRGTDREHQLADGTSGEDPYQTFGVASYIAKYATKGAEAAGTLDTALVCRACGGTGRWAPETPRSTASTAPAPEAAVSWTPWLSATTPDG